MIKKQTHRHNTVDKGTGANRKVILKMYNNRTKNIKSECNDEYEKENGNFKKCKHILKVKV